MTPRFFVVLFLWLIAMAAFAQEEPADSLKTTPSDTLRQEEGKKVITIDTYAARFDPRKAILYAAILPGSGQVYNKKYWKVPIVLAGFGTGVYMISFYQKKYILYKEELYGVLSGGPKKSPSGFDETQLRRLVTLSNRERDFFTIITGFWYILQLVDAHVDAHLKEFDLNPQLQVRVEPMTESSPLTGRSTGISLKIKF